MKVASRVALLVLLTGLAAVHAGEVTPISTVLNLLTDLQAKITSEGADSAKLYHEFQAWADEQSKNLEFGIKTAKSEKRDLAAKIEEEVAIISALQTKVNELIASIASDDADSKAATEVRSKEAKDFASQEKELMETMNMVERAVGILQREVQKHGASMLQTKNAGNLAEALTSVLNALAFSSADAAQLTALVQSAHQSDSDDEGLGAPDPAAYKQHSGNIIDVLEGLLEKAHSQLSELRKKETSALHNFQMLAQGLEDGIKFAKNGLADAKRGLAESSEKKAGAEGDLEMTSKDLTGDVAALEDIKRDVVTKAADFEAETTGRAEELKALAEAKKIISESTGGAGSITYTQVSFLQLAQNSENAEVLRFVQNLAQKQHSPVLSQLAKRLVAAVQYGAGAGSDPFSKVRSLIADLLKRLESEAGADATHKAFCDKELAETSEKKGVKAAEIEKLSSRIDQMVARSAQLKEQVAELLTAISELHASQKKMSEIREAEHALFVKNKPELEQGIAGVKMAMKVLRDYYAQGDQAHGSATDAATGIIGILEVVESDFSKGLTEMTVNEDSAQAAYEKETQENKLELANKEQDVKYKNKESSGLDKATAEVTSDRVGVQDEEDAVLEYWSKLQNQCIAKAETYGNRSKQRAAEIAGLKEALAILEGEASLIQQKAKRTLRVSNPRS